MSQVILLSIQASFIVSKNVSEADALIAWVESVIAYVIRISNTTAGLNVAAVVYCTSKVYVLDSVKKVSKSYGAEFVLMSSPGVHHVAVPYSLFSYVVVKAHESSLARLKLGVKATEDAPVLTR